MVTMRQAAAALALICALLAGGSATAHGQVVPGTSIPGTTETSLDEDPSCATTGGVEPCLALAVSPTTGAPGTVIEVRSSLGCASDTVWFAPDRPDAVVTTVPMTIDATGGTARVVVPAGTPAGHASIFTGAPGCVAEFWVTTAAQEAPVAPDLTG